MALTKLTNSTAQNSGAPSDYLIVHSNLFNPAIDVINGLQAGTQAASVSTLAVASTSAFTGVATFTAGAVFSAANTYKAVTGATALAGGAQAGTAISAEYTNFTTVSTALDSAQLPTAALGKKFVIKNSAAVPMAVFGQTGASIDGQAANASVLVAPNQTKTFYGISSTAWLSDSAGVSVVSPVISQEITLTATEIVGTSAGDLGHASGAICIPGVSSAFALEFVSAILIYDFDTAAYTDGGNDLVVCISGGGATLSGATSAANLIGAAGDKIVSVYPLTAAGNPLSVGTGFNLKSTAWTQPGTAAGVLRCQFQYRIHKTGL